MTLCELIESTKLYLFDLDGTLYLSEEVFPYTAELLAEIPFAVLDENGEDIREAETLPENFLLSDHMNFTEEEMELIKDLPKYSVGPRVLHADHTITVLLNEFDRRAGNV